MSIYTREQAVAAMNTLVNGAQASLEEAAAIGSRWGIPFEYNLTGAVDEPQWENSDSWYDSGC